MQRVRREAELAEHAASSMIGKQSDVSFDLAVIIDGHSPP